MRSILSFHTASATSGRPLVVQFRVESGSDVERITKMDHLRIWSCLIYIVEPISGLISGGRAGPCGDQRR